MHPDTLPPIVSAPSWRVFTLPRSTTPPSAAAVSPRPPNGSTRGVQEGERQGGGAGDALAPCRQLDAGLDPRGSPACALAGVPLPGTHGPPTRPPLPHHPPPSSSPAGGLRPEPLQPW